MSQLLNSQVTSISESAPVIGNSKVKPEKSEIKAANEKTKSRANNGINVANTNNKNAREFKVKSTNLNFLGLDKNGLPTGFTITDSRGNLGDLYIKSQDMLVDDQEIIIPFISKTISGAANVFLNQTITQDASGVRYDVQISYGKNGLWAPVVSRVISTEIERLTTGNYILTSVIQVKSEIVTPIEVQAYAKGRDLMGMPLRVVTRIHLNSSKSSILGQAVLVTERSN